MNSKKPDGSLLCVTYWVPYKYSACICMICICCICSMMQLRNLILKCSWEKMKKLMKEWRIHPFICGFIGCRFGINVYLPKTGKCIHVYIYVYISMHGVLISPKIILQNFLIYFVCTLLKLKTIHLCTCSCIDATDQTIKSSGTACIYMYFRIIFEYHFEILEPPWTGENSMIRNL